MNYTNNHHLPQWVESDRVRMSDFNAAMASIESGLSASAQAAQTAQSAAEIAHNLAAIARNEANEKPYTVGHYTGNGKLKQISLGYRPSFLLFTGAEAADSANSPAIIAFTGMLGSTTLASRCKIIDTGFQLLPSSDENGTYPDLNQSGRAYDYIAFR